MGHSISYQFKSAIDKGEMNLRESIDKNSLKHSGDIDTMCKVYSYNERRTLLEVSHQMKDYLKENHPNIRYIKDINSDHWISFLDYKSNTLSNASLKNMFPVFQNYKLYARTSLKSI